MACADWAVFAGPAIDANLGAGKKNQADAEPETGAASDAAGAGFLATSFSKVGESLAPLPRQ